MQIIEVFATKNKCYQVTVCPTFGFIGCPTPLPCQDPKKGITGRQKAHKSILRNDPNSNHERSGAMTGMEVFTTVLGEAVLWHRCSLLVHWRYRIAAV